ncbi:hypothetical protein ACIBF6_41105 [Streptosporangium amethystogenes]|uniref:hypothetical protein n=1 Tax=Streptosporangium amethystogenes TaxID=2002 RepID=UPI0037A908D2
MEDIAVVFLRVDPFCPRSARLPRAPRPSSLPMPCMSPGGRQSQQVKGVRGPVGSPHRAAFRE